MVPGVTEVEQQAAVLVLVVAVGGSCQVEEGYLDASSDALHHLPTQHQVRDLPKAAGDKDRAMTLHCEASQALSPGGTEMGGKQGPGMFLHEPNYSHPKSVRRKY